VRHHDRDKNQENKGDLAHIGALLPVLKEMG
jgi:hypothetical protein